MSAADDPRGSAKPLASPFLGAAFIFVLTISVYIPAINGGFIWDDDGFLTQNPLIKATDGLYRFWFTKEAPDYFPLVSSSLWLEWRIWGENPRGYHLTNVLLHAFSSLLLWKLFQKLKLPGAWVCGVIFAVHPVNVESVAWITERKNTLPMPLYLLTFISFLQFEKSGKAVWYFLSLFLFVLALTAKPMVIMLPFVILLFAWWQRGGVNIGDVKRTVPFFIISIFFGLLTVWFQYSNAIGDDVVGYPDLPSRFSGAGLALVFYLNKALMPLNLSFIYPRWSIDTDELLNYLPSIIIFFTSLYLVRKQSSEMRPLLFALAYFIITLFPVLGFLDIYFMRYSFVADHWQYAAIPGITGLLGGSVFRLYEERKKTRGIVLFSGTLTIIFFSVLTWKQCEAYRDRETLWRATISKNPAAFLAHNDLGNILKLRGEFKEALEHYSLAIKSNPDFVETHNNIGTLLAKMGKPERALEHFFAAMKIKPTSEIVHNSLGNTLARMGRYNEAESFLKKALVLNREFVPTYINLGYLFSLQQKHDESINIYREALRKYPKNPMLNLNMGVSMAKSGDLESAIKYYYLALDMKPGYSQAHRNLGVALNRAGEYEKARYHFSMANP